jgi:glycosyltransferase involved in cell wall biosynthesis
VRYRLVVLATHPIQYKAPLFRYLAQEPWLDLEVWYGDRYGVEPRESAWGVRDFTWDVNLLEGYRHRFFRNWSLRPEPSTRFGIVTLGLRNELARTRPDAVWISGYAKLHSWASFGAALSKRIAIIYNSDTNAFAEPTGMKRALKHAVVERLYGVVDAFLVTGTSNERHYEMYGVTQEKRFFVPWAIDNALFADGADRALLRRDQIRSTWGVRSGHDVLLFVGRLTSTKAPELLISVTEAVPNVHAVFAGSGPLESELRARASRLIPGRATFLGFTKQTELPAVYSASDLLILPSSYEPWGLVINEALASGCPAAASEAVGAAYDLVPSELRFPIVDQARLCDVVRNFRTLRSTQPDMISWARARVGEFSFDRDARGILAALESLSHGR